MPIETLDDIIEEIADRRGIYGAHGDAQEDETPSCEVTCTPKKPCRVCWTAGLHDRILAAVDVERKLQAVPAPVEQNPTAKDSLTIAPAEPEREWCLAWEWDTDPQGGTRRVIAKSEADADNCICNVDSRTLRKQWRTKAGDWQDAALLPAERAGKETK